MPRLLRSLDLFSGIGGITQALEGIARPQAYCEIDPDCQTILKGKIGQRLLPKAPIITDVRQLTRKHLAKSGIVAIDIIVGGWPCQDLSSLGKRKGLKGARSGLIYEVLRLTDELKPPMLFLENVPPLLTNGIDVIIDEFVNKRNYELRWAVIPASAIGAPHSRKRWYGFLVHPERLLNRNFAPSPSWDLSSYRLFEWKKEPQRMILPRTLDQKRDALVYSSKLGNSVVPDAVRSAFITLASGFENSPKDLRSIRRLRYRPSVSKSVLAGTMPHGKYTSWGIAAAKTMTVLSVLVPKMKEPSLKLVFDPKTYDGVATGPVATSLITTPIYARAWSTPRYTLPFCNVLTERSARDLPTQIRFERSTPNHLRAGIVNGAFVEWLMGYRPFKYNRVQKTNI